MKKDARANFNFYVPMFTKVGMNTVDIQDIVLDDGGAGTVGWGDVMQIVGPNGNASAVYLFHDATMDPEQLATKSYWGDDAYNPVTVSFDKGDGIAIDNAGGLEFAIQNAGDVIDTNVRFAAGGNFNWTGNPFATAISIQDIVLDDGGAGIVGWGDVMQIVGPHGNASEVYLFHDATMDPEQLATKSYWGDDAYNKVAVTIQPGSGFAIDNASELAFDIVVKCPYAK